jgi:hypothetical protein
VTLGLRHHGEDAFIRCYICGADAAGPCAKCRNSVCGDCCVLVDGAAQKWAVCTRCSKAEHSKLGGWGALAWFFVKIVAFLLGIIFLLAYLQK